MYNKNANISDYPSDIETTYSIFFNNHLKKNNN